MTPDCIMEPFLYDEEIITKPKSPKKGKKDEQSKEENDEKEEKEGSLSLLKPEEKGMKKIKKEVERSEIMNFFCDFLKNDVLGIICIRFLA